ncbi:hypothetical protein KCTCHS21_37930 [Cohnella abietis]|uniref:Uncharacterized protein n=1 Tax=Cohnella abietis TaxID=2507935 RepID=A0A3T1D8J3_9BACL|nr:hypothetical protein KCTCHS21_37930 [Cohnella abietis]
MDGFRPDLADGFHHRCYIHLDLADGFHLHAGCSYLDLADVVLDLGKKLARWKELLLKVSQVQ